VNLKGYRFGRCCSFCTTLSNFCAYCPVACSLWTTHYKRQILLLGLWLALVLWLGVGLGLGPEPTVASKHPICQCHTDSNTSYLINKLYLQSATYLTACGYSSYLTYRVCNVQENLECSN